MSILFLVAIVIFIFVLIFQISKASEYVSVLKGEETTRKQSNKINAFLFIAFLVLGFVGVFVCHEMFKGKTLLAFPSASLEGEKFDQIFRVTLIITGIVFIVTQFLLFTFVYRFQEKEGRKAFYYPHNNTLEWIWTVIPAIFMLVLVVIGLIQWFKITAPAPPDAIEVEITGKQFNWIYRYPGNDKKLGRTWYKRIDDKANNPLGLVWEDPATKDDVLPTEIHIPKGIPIKLVINSRDVIHDVGLNHFRMKMDAVPGIPTTLTFTAKYTTNEMREMMNDPEFDYEIACDQMCGPGHTNMRGIIKVDDPADYKVWLKSQKPFYETVFSPTVVDSAVVVSVQQIKDSTLKK